MLMKFRLSEKMAMTSSIILPVNSRVQSHQIHRLNTHICAGEMCLKLLIYARIVNGLSLIYVEIKAGLTKINST